MATFKVDNRLTTGSNNGTSDANAWHSLYDVMAGIAAVSAGDTIQFVAGSGPYRECLLTGTGMVVASDISFASGAPATIVSQANAMTGFTAGTILRVVDEAGVNSGQYTSAGVTGVGPYTLTLHSTNKVTTQAAGGRVRISIVSSTSAQALNFSKNGSATSKIIWDLNGCEVSAGLDVMTSAYKWTLSAAGTNEYYLTRADGSNPSLNAVTVAVVNGIYQTASASDTTFKIGTVSSLADGYLGFGNADTLGFNTVYVRSNSGNPATVGMAVQIGQVAAVVDTNWGYHRVQDGTLSFGMVVSGTNGATVRARGTSWNFSRVKFRYAENHGFEGNTGGPFTLDHCVSYFSGHRFIAQSGDCVINVYNSGDYGSHLFAIQGTSGAAPNYGLTSAAILNIYNCWSMYNESGAIDKKSAAAVLNEDYNRWYPSLRDATMKLGYVSTANWTTTGPNDSPASTATTVNSGFVDPAFVATSNLGLEHCDFNLSQSSALFRAGASGIGLHYQGIGEATAHSAVNQNIGPYATRKLFR